MTVIGHTVMPRCGGRDGPPSRGKEDSLGGALAIEAQCQLVQIADVEIKRYEQLLADPDPVQEQPVRQRWPGLAGVVPGPAGRSVLQGVARQAGQALQGIADTRRARSDVSPEHG